MGPRPTSFRRALVAALVMAATLAAPTTATGGPAAAAAPAQTPPQVTCVTAANSAHVAAGRATAFLIFAFAAGSGQYIGLTFQSTSLRETSPGVWSRVTTC